MKCHIHWRSIEGGDKFRTCDGGFPGDNTRSGPLRELRICVYISPSFRYERRRLDGQSNARMGTAIMTPRNPVRRTARKAPILRSKPKIAYVLHEALAG
jgi:hypothetical protein